MTEAQAISTSAAVAIGPGRLVLVVGPSGAGKDTLLTLARAACAGDAGIVFPRRVVTRPASPAEDNAQITLDVFREALGRGDLAVHWEAHGHCYAIPRSIDDDVRAGRTVVFNASRTVVDKVRRTYAHVVVVSITAPPNVLAERLTSRGRDSDGPIEPRLRRAVDAAVADATIVNVGAVEPHVRSLIQIIKGLKPQTQANGCEIG
jgi:ribose 1,5-bisphosphokinase